MNNIFKGNFEDKKLFSISKIINNDNLLTKISYYHEYNWTNKNILTQYVNKFKYNINDKITVLNKFSLNNDLKFSFEYHDKFNLKLIKKLSNNGNKLKLNFNYQLYDNLDFFSKFIFKDSINLNTKFYYKFNDFDNLKDVLFKFKYDIIKENKFYFKWNYLQLIFKNDLIFSKWY